MQTSTEFAHAEDYRKRHAEESLMDSAEMGAIIELRGMSWCSLCASFVSSSRPVRIDGCWHDVCRDCRPFDRTCEACGKAEAYPGCDGCLACEIEVDLHDLEQARLARALFHVFMGLANDKLSVRAEITGAM